MDSRSEGAAPSVSIIIPARNEERLIAAALRSVIAQTYPGGLIECVVVDNASSDHTACQAMKFAQEHPQFQCQVVSEPVPGVGGAKNRGARVAWGDVLVFLDADSRMEGNLVREIVSSWDGGCQVGSIRVLADSGRLLDRSFFALMEVGKVALGVRAQMLFCGRDLFLRLGGFNPELSLGEDVDFLKRAREHLGRSHSSVCHVRSSAIRTSPRRLQEGPLRLGMVRMFGRWALAFLGIGRGRPY